MNEHLLLITIGPVQEFIAQARRTRDLWFGSHLLSELSRNVASTLVGNGARLVFPPLEEGNKELVSCMDPLRSNGEPPLNIANKILAEVPAESDPQRLARVARERVMRYWHDEIAEEVKQRMIGLLAEGTDQVWVEQISSFLEFTAVWTKNKGYAESRLAVEGALSSRKNLRDFAPWRQLRGGVPMSSLDGARETVLRPPEKREKKLVRKYRIADGEQLDAVGLIKRAGGKPDQFVPIINVALAPWISLAAQEAPKALNRLREACQKVGMARVERHDLAWNRPFPFDASVLLSSRWRTLFDELGLDGNSDTWEKWGSENVTPLLRHLGEPYPYVACLVADGDRLGQTIGAINSANRHREFSGQVACFAMKARRLVEQEHRGSLVYAGGDDVLAFLPLPDALKCAEKLRQSFAKIMQDACSSLPVDRQPTLSVGIGIGHVMDGMGDLLALGREAEKLAKSAHLISENQDRNALAIILDKRSGGRRFWRTRWDEWEGGPVHRLTSDILALEEKLPSRKVYEIGRTLSRLPDPTMADDPKWTDVLIWEVRRSLERAHSGQGVMPEDVGLRLDPRVEYKALHGVVKGWVDRILVARVIATAIPRLRNNIREGVAA